MAKRRGQLVSATNAKKSRIINNNRGESSDDDTDSINTAVSQASNGSSQTVFTRCGKVLAVKLRNFMCHENLTVNFNREANLLIGKNGSGKSAVLTALILGLGCKANATNRSNSVKQLVRTGETTAQIEIRLSNNGFDPYEKDKFGEEIVIVRQIGANGSSTYKLKSERGEVVSTKRADLDKLVFYMNIQADNPVCVLTQDAARGFLREGNPKKQYEMFLKASQLDIIYEKLIACNSQLKTYKVSLDSQLEQSGELQKAYVDAQQLVSRLDSVNPIKQELVRLKNAKKWFPVVNAENLVAEFREAMEKIVQDKQKAVEKSQNLVNDAEQWEQKLRECNVIIDASIEQVREKREQLNATKELFRQSNERTLEHDREVKKLQSKKDRILNDIRKLENRAATNENDEVTQLKAEHKLKIQEYDKLLEEIKSTIESYKCDIEMMTNSEDEYKQQSAVLDGERRQVLDDITHTKQHLQRSSQKLPGRALEVYGQFVPALVKELERLHATKKLSKMPIGPIGDYIEVKNPKHRQFVENICDRFLGAFIVDSVKDSLTVKKLLKTRFERATQIPIITMPFRDQVYQIGNKRVAADPRYVVLMDMVNIDNATVMNCFLDHIKGDTIVFVKSIDDATRLTDRLENVPPNLSRVLSMDPYTEFYPAPNYRSYARDIKPARFLRVASDVSNDYYLTELERLKEEKMAIDEKIQTMNRKVNENQRVLKERRQNMIKLNNEVMAIDRKKFELTSYEYPEETEVSLLLREIEAQKKCLEKVDEELDAAIAQKQTADAEVKRLEAEVKGFRQFLRNAEDETAEANKNKEEAQEKIASCTASTAVYARTFQKYDTAIANCTKELDDANRKLAKAIATAEKSGPRPDLNQSEQDVDELIRNRERRINMIDSTKVTIEEATKTLEQCKKAFEDNQKLCASMEDVLSAGIESTTARFNKIKRLGIQMEARASFYFHRYLSLRSTQGELIFNQDEKTLTISVIPRDVDTVTKAGDIKSLSGGERSYVTVSFLMSLWKCVDHPFFFLDEYDVFTDHVNRKYLTTLLLQEAKKFNEFQYTFLTPQDLTDITTSESLSIQRLKEPSR